MVLTLLTVTHTHKHTKQTKKAIIAQEKKKNNTTLQNKYTFCVQGESQVEAWPFSYKSIKVYKVLTTYFLTKKSWIFVCFCVRKGLS